MVWKVLLMRDWIDGMGRKVVWIVLAGDMDNVVRTHFDIVVPHH